MGEVGRGFLDLDVNGGWHWPEALGREDDGLLKLGVLLREGTVASYQWAVFVYCKLL